MVDFGRSSLPLNAPKNATISQLKEFVERKFWFIDGLTAWPFLKVLTEQGDPVVNSQRLNEFPPSSVLVFVARKQQKSIPTKGIPPHRRKKFI
jgi:hypothetical protein